MKYIFLVVLFLSTIFSVKAQTLKPEIKLGTTFFYNFELHGQHASFEITVKSFTDTLKLNWKIRNLAGGNYAVTPVAWQNANQLNFAQPEPFKTVKLTDQQTFMLISKAAYQNLISKHQYTYDHTVYVLKRDLKENPLKLGTQNLDVLHVVAQDETTELWILNNPDFPFICQIKGNPLGINVDLKEIK